MLLIIIDVFYARTTRRMRRECDARVPWKARRTLGDFPSRAIETYNAAILKINVVCEKNKLTIKNRIIQWCV